MSDPPGRQHDVTDDDLATQLRPATPEEWPAFVRAMSHGFGEDPSGPYLDSVPPVAEIDRSLGLWDGERVAVTAGIYSRSLTVPGAVVPCAGITWVTVSPTHRRRGVLTAIMRRQLTELHEQQREPVAALWAAEFPIYGRFGYAPATFRGNLTGRTERLRLRPDVDLGSGRVDIVPKETYQPAATARARAAASVRAGQPGARPALVGPHPAGREGGPARRDRAHLPAAHRGRRHGDRVRHLPHQVGVDRQRRARRHADRRGGPGHEHTRLRIALALPALGRPDPNRAAPLLSPDDPIRSLVTDGRALHASAIDALWVRLVDVDRALAARRYPAPLDLVIEVRDEFCPWNAGRWRVSGHPAGGYCGRTDLDPDLVLGIEELSAAYLGGVSLATLHAAGRVTEVSPGAVTLAATAFSWPVTPWCPDEF